MKKVLYANNSEVFIVNSSTRTDLSNGMVYYEHLIGK